MRFLTYNPVIWQRSLGTAEKGNHAGQLPPYSSLWNKLVEEPAELAAGRGGRSSSTSSR